MTVDGSSRPGAPGRPRGARNAGYDDKRRELVRRVRESLLAHGADVSLQSLARDAGVSIPTLKHYLGDREHALETALRAVEADSAPYVAPLRDPGELPLRGSLEKVGRDLVTAWRLFGVGRVFSTGLAAGLSHERIGPGYLDGVLEPTVLALEARLGVHAARGEIDVAPDDALGLRAAALMFVSPILVAMLHQDGLGGARCRPLDVERFVGEVVGRFAAAYERRKPAPPARRPARRKRR